MRSFSLHSVLPPFAVSLMASLLLLTSAPIVQGDALHVPGEVIVGMRVETTFQQVESALGRHRCQPQDRIPGLRAILATFADRRSAEEAATELATEPAIAYAHPNHLGQGGDFSPNDTYFGQQWHLHNTGQLGGKVDADIDAVEGWQLTRGSSRVTVAVLDTGIDSDHPELVGRCLPGYDFVNEDADPEADHSHGPEVTGLLAANSDNAFAIAGVDHFCQILPVKVLDHLNQGTTFDLMQGLDYAAAQHADVISMSLINYPADPGLAAALSAARDSGCVLVACAGNGGIGDADESWPGASPHTISVGWINQWDVRNPGSATGSALDFVAPGVNLRTLAWDTSSDTYVLFSGCSAATPIAAGIASLCLALDSTLTHDDIYSLLTAGAEDQVGPPSQDTPGWDPYFGHGRVNLDRTLRALATDVPPAVASGEAFPASHRQGTSPVRILAATPSPFEQGTTVHFALAREGRVSLEIHSVRGERVRTLVIGTLPAGVHRLTWDGKGSGGEDLAPGVYFVHLRAGEGADTRRVVLVR